MQVVESDFIVDTASGPVRGRREHGTIAWRGIPFAAPPVGEQRFRAPTKPAPWSQVRDATRYGPVPSQRRATPSAGAGRTTPMSEDCLTVSVLRRSTAGARRPVMVYIYGGAFAIGSSSASAYGGERFVANGDVVFVGFNYRLGAFGWLDFSRYSTPERPIESNLGLRDQIAALTWVRENIAAFGGDPDNVTLFGESAGGTSVATLMTVPRARGLFARAIVQSSVAGAVYSRERTAEWAAQFVGMLGVPEAAAAETLLAAPPDALISATTQLDDRINEQQPGVRVLAPVIDGELLPKHPLDAFQAGESHAIPLIIGTNANEGTLFQRVVRSLAATPTRIDRLFELTAPDAKTGVLDLYPSYPRGRSIADLVTDLMFWHPSIVIAAGHAQIAPTWMYRFDFSTRLFRLIGLGATHAAELPFVFGRPDSSIVRVAALLGGGRAARAVSARMHGRWLSFASGGDADGGVGGDSDVHWPRYDAESRRTLVIDDVDRVEADLRRAARRALEPWQSYR